MTLGKRKGQDIPAFMHDNENQNTAKKPATKQKQTNKSKQTEQSNIPSHVETCFPKPRKQGFKTPNKPWPGNLGLQPLAAMAALRVQAAPAEPWLPIPRSNAGGGGFEANAGRNRMLGRLKRRNEKRVVKHAILGNVLPLGSATPGCDKV